MFVAAEFQSIRNSCLAELEMLLKKLSVPTPDWSGNEYRIYERLDDDITKKICALMKSSSIIEGYTKLLKFGGIPYDYSETDNELLRKIVANKEKIRHGAKQANQPVMIKTSPPPEPQPVRQSEPPQLEMRTVTKETHVTLTGLIIFGTILIVFGLMIMFLFDSKIGCGISALLGVVSAFIGVRGKTVRTTTTVPVTPAAPVTPQPVQQQSVRQPESTRMGKKPYFSQDELQKIFDVLTQVDKIVRVI